MKPCDYSCGTAEHVLSRRRFFTSLAGAGAAAVMPGFGIFTSPARAADMARQPKRMIVIHMAGGLSQLGGRLVDRLVALGVILDLAHASTATFADVLARIGDAPVLVSHAACRAVNDHPRNVTDEQLRALADRGGLLGIMLHPLAIGHEQRTIGRVIDHFEHAASVMGIEHVCLGGDFVQRLSRVLPPFGPLPDGLMPPGLEEGSSIEGLAGPEDYPALGEALEAGGWSAADIEAVTGANLLQFLRRALPA